MVQSRRNFFRSVPALAALPASWTAFSQALTAAPAPTSEAYWSLVRQQFPLQPGLVYLNAANVCPSSRPVLDRHLEFLRDFHANPSFQNRAKYKETQESLRTKLAAVLGVTADEIAITRNTSEGSNVIVHGIDLKPGDEVIVTEHNHPSNNDSWKVRARRDGFVVKELPVTIPARSADDLIGAFDKAITPKTRLVALTHLTSVTGILYPVREITELAQKRGAWVHLDGAQTFGAMDVNLKQIGCDSFAGSSHKWMMGPLENGVLFVKAGQQKRIWPSIVTAGWEEHLQGARKFEVLGQRDDPRIAAFEAAIDFFNLISAANVERRTRELSTMLKVELAKLPGIEMKTNQEAGLSLGVIKAKVRGKDTKQCYDQLWERRKLALSLTTSGPAEGLRFSPHIYNSREDLDHAVDAVRELIKG